MVMRRFVPFGRSNLDGCSRKWRWMFDTSSDELFCFFCWRFLPAAVTGAALRATRSADIRWLRTLTGTSRVVCAACFVITSPGRRLLITSCRFVDDALVVARALCTYNGADGVYDQHQQLATHAFPRSAAAAATTTDVQLLSTREPSRSSSHSPADASASSPSSSTHSY